MSAFSRSNRDVKRIPPGFWTFERTALTGFTSALLILTTIGIVAFTTTTRLIDTANWIWRTNHIQESLSDLRARLTDVESDARGYVITGLEEYLPHYYSGVEKAWGAYRDLEKSVEDADQRKRLSRLFPLLNDRIAIARTTIDVRRSEGFGAAEKLGEGGSGKKVMNEIRAVLDEMEFVQRKLLSERSDYARRNAGRAELVSAVGLALAILIVGFAGFIMRRGAIGRQRSEKELQESRLNLQEFLDNGNDLIISVGPDGRFIYANKRWRETLGYGDSDLSRIRFHDAVHPDYRQQAESYRQRGSAGQKTDEFETVFVTKDGQSVTVSGRMDPRMEDGRLTLTRCMFRNISESKRAEEALQRSNEVLIRSVNELEQRTREISTMSEMGDLLQSCQKLDEAYKVISEFVPQMIPSDGGALGAIAPSHKLVEIVAEWGTEKSSERVFSPEDCWALRRGRMHVVKERGSALYCRHLGEATPGSYFCVPLVAQGNAVGLLHVEASSGKSSESFDLGAPTKLRLIEAVADRIALAMANLNLQELMRQQSVRDPLTGLFNRRYMEESLERELRRAARSNRPLGILMLDLDFFKAFNDNLGHDAGDAMLREFGRLLEATFRGGDIACRYGGEEFALILPEASLEATSQRGEVLREKTKRLIVQHRGLSLGAVTVSVGVAAFPQHGSTSEELLRAADEALYTAKQAGRDRVVVAPLTK
jgi:diguanylate cyclase (GGDEF)-like protein/PAS domain S-box-containing protein